MDTCFNCGKPEDFENDPESELRPYGPGGQNVCFRCAFSTPELEQTASDAVAARLNAIYEKPGLIGLVFTDHGPEGIYDV